MDKTKEIPQPPKKDKKKGETEGPPIELTDPTSVTLINSFLIKNAGPTFDNYHKNMATKKKTGGSYALAGNSPTQASFTMNGTGNSPNNPGGVNSKNIYGKVSARPAARDGHSGIIFNGRFIVFGGDRHQCPFNDLHFLSIEQEF